MASYMDINDRIFKMLDELDADPSEATLEKGKLVNQLLTTAINSNNSAMRAAQMQESAMDGLAMMVGTSRVLLGQPVMEATLQAAAELPSPDFDPIAWVRANGTGQTVYWIRDRLNKAAHFEYGFDEVRAICDEARVEPIELDTKSDLRRAEAEGYAVHGPVAAGSKR